jgi:short-subunit dehydrogenase
LAFGFHLAVADRSNSVRSHAEGFTVGLISRDQARLDGLAATLTGDGVEAKGFAADVRDPASVAHALEQVTETLGPIEVLQYSPLPQKDFMRPVQETMPQDLVGPIEFSIYGPVAAVHQVVPGMRCLGDDRGTILFVNGGTAVTPRAHLAGTSIAFAGQAAYAQMLNEILGAEGIQVSQLVIPGAIVPGEKKDPRSWPTCCGTSISSGTASVCRWMSRVDRPRTHRSGPSRSAVRPQRDARPPQRPRPRARRRAR